MGWKTRFRQFYIILAAIILTFVIYGDVVSASEKEKHGKKPETATTTLELDQEKEFIEFCDKQAELRSDPDSIKRDCKRIHEKDFTRKDLRILFSLMMIILWGAIVRTLLKTFKINIPYTVVLMLSGIIIGVIARYRCYQLYTFTSIARLKPQVILFAFLPVLIFETAFGISSHVFLKASMQILLAAFPGMLIATVLTAMLCYQFFSAYKWTFLQSLFYGSIISATDPVAVVSILKEVGVAESLSVIIDGESLLNDGVAILLYEIFKELLQETEELGTGELAAKIIVMFIQIAIGGPVFGFVAAKIAIFCLARIFNDAIVEITITLVSAYMTYYIAEDVLHVSGVCAVVLLGITMSSEKTCISPEILEEVHEFWEMAAHLANTALFFITGIVISERGSRDLMPVDLYYLIMLYCALNFIRFFMLLALSPLLSRCGYGLTWQNLIVMMWGGLRGGIGICLSLEVYEDTFFCNDTQLGPKILFHTAGIVLLTLLINGTTTKKLLELLGLTAVSSGQIEEMQIALKHVMDTQKKTLAMLKHDRYLSDSNWDYINKYTQMSNPYKDIQVKQKKPQPKSSILSIHEDSHQHPCPVCLTLVENEPSGEEYRVMTDEARLRVLKALKISYWTQFEQGILTEEAVKILVSVSEQFTDVEMSVIHTQDLKKYWEIRGFTPWFRAKMIAQFGPTGRYWEKTPPKPNLKFRVPFWWIISRTWFETMMTVVIMLNMIPAIWEFALDIQMGSECDNSHKIERTAFFYINFIFTVIYFAEFVCKVLGRGLKEYYLNKWNYIDFFVLLISIMDIVLSFYPCEKNKTNMGFTKILRGLRLFRIVRAIRLIKPLIPAIIRVLNARVNKLMFFGYDVALGYLTAIDDVLKYINQMIENAHVARKLKIHLEKEKTESVKEIGLIQRDHPGIAIAVKTRIASRSVLNQMRSALIDLRMDGLLDEKENMLLTIELEERMKRLWNSPSYIPPSSPEVLLENLSWVYGNSLLKDFIFSNAQSVTFQAGDIIAASGDEPDGLYVIISGMVRISYEPTENAIDNRQKYGVIPNIEIFRDFDFDKLAEDFFSCGTVIGESGILTRRVRSGSVVCESDQVTAYFIPLSIMDDALAKFNDESDSLEIRLWRSCGIRRGCAYLPTTAFYQAWSSDKIKMHIERSCVPIGSFFATLELPSYVLDVFVIEGYVQDYVTGEMFIAPSLVNRGCTKLICNVENPKTLNRILLITQDNIGTEVVDDDLARCVVASYQYRRGLKRDQNQDEALEEKGGFQIFRNFGARRKKRRKNIYTTDDDLSTKDENIRRRAGIKEVQSRRIPGRGESTASTKSSYK